MTWGKYATLWKYRRKTSFSRSRDPDPRSVRGKLVHELKLLVRVRVWGWIGVMVEIEFGTCFQGMG